MRGNFFFFSIFLFSLHNLSTSEETPNVPINCNHKDELLTLMDVLNSLNELIGNDNLSEVIKEKIAFLEKKINELKKSKEQECTSNEGVDVSCDTHQGQNIQENTQNLGDDTADASAPTKGSLPCCNDGKIENEEALMVGQSTSKHFSNNMMGSKGEKKGDTFVGGSHKKPEEYSTKGEDGEEEEGDNGEEPHYEANTTFESGVDLPLTGENEGIGVTGNAMGTSNAKTTYSRKFYDDILANLKKKSKGNNNNYQNRYNQFKKEYDMFMNLSENEYEIIKKLVDAFSKNTQVFNDNTDSVFETIKKAFVDKEFREEFKEFMQGIYTHAKQHNYLRGDKTEENNVYLTLFENVLKLLNSL
ncbi:merozoite surface protein 7 (MSP7), putative [Plasmodium ovale curtisi]|uniref:Merozoite surface protein 7 (MSP7), putative n=1 Tax=Plasmodium ovale curtisi TaxID=864141 RepID=A0A1A8WWM9_PLAOA|nr:merozoite surface protein 7 (MSP7), putative [Plasmodium ovale curtisi]